MRGPGEIVEEITGKRLRRRKFACDRVIAAAIKQRFGIGPNGEARAGANFRSEQQIADAGHPKRAFLVSCGEVDLNRRRKTVSDRKQQRPRRDAALPGNAVGQRMQNTTAKRLGSQQRIRCGRQGRKQTPEQRPVTVENPAPAFGDQKSDRGREMPEEGRTG